MSHNHENFPNNHEESESSEAESRARRVGALTIQESGIQIEEVVSALDVKQEAARKAMNSNIVSILGNIPPQILSQTIVQVLQRSGKYKSHEEIQKSSQKIMAEIYNKSINLSYDQAQQAINQIMGSGIHEVRNPAFWQETPNPNGSMLGRVRYEAQTTIEQIILQLDN